MAPADRVAVLGSAEAPAVLDSVAQEVLVVDRASAEAPAVLEVQVVPAKGAEAEKEAAVAREAAANDRSVLKATTDIPRRSVSTINKPTRRRFPS